MEFLCRFLLLFVILTTFDQNVAKSNGKDSQNDAQQEGQRPTLRNLEDIRLEIDEYVGKVMTAGRIPGFSLSVVNGDVDSLISGYGVMNIDRGDSVDVNSLFMIGSTTKAFTAALLLQLLRERNISLETPVKELLPDFQLADFYRQQKATTRDILTHRMGIPDSVNNYVFGDVLSREELTRRSLYFKPLIPFRGAYYYSNMNYNHAGKIIETLTGQTWEEVVRERLYVPLRMDNSTFYNQLTPEQQSRLVTPYEPYWRNNGSVMREVPSDFHKHIHIGGPGCCVVSSAADLVHWLYTMTHGGLNEAGERVLDEQVVRDVMSPQSIRSVQPGFQPFTFVSDNYGFGWDTGFYQGYRMAIHDGYTYGFRSLASVYPELKLGIFTCINGKLGTSTAMIDVHLFIANLLVMGKEWTHGHANDVPLIENDHSAIQAIHSHVTYGPSYDQLERLLVDARRRHLDSKKVQDPFLDEHVGVYGNFAFGNLSIQVDVTTGRLSAYYGDLLTLDLFQVDTERFVSPPPEVAWFYPVFEVTFTRDANDNTVVSATVPTLFQDDPPVFIRGLRRDEAPLPPTCGPC